MPVTVATTLQVEPPTATRRGFIGAGLRVSHGETIIAGRDREVISTIDISAEDPDDLLAIAQALIAASRDARARWHTLSEPTIPDPILPEIGAPFGGGLFAGQVEADGRPHALIVAPKAEGEAKSPMPWAEAGAFCGALSIAGHTDWHLPSLDDMTVLRANLLPGRTSAPAFKPDGCEVFETDYWYWTSTEFAPGSAWVQFFRYGLQYNYYKDWSARVRAVRKIPL